MIPTAAGEYRGITMPEYLAAPAVSAGIIKDALSSCPQAAWFESWLNPQRPRTDEDATEGSDAGTIAHSIVLEGGAGSIEEINPLHHPAKSGGGIPTGWTNQSIRAARDAARASGKIPVLTSQMAEIRAMADSVTRFIATLAGTEPAIYRMFQPGEGDSELTFLWDDDGTLCRNRPDRIAADRKLVVDLKFTDLKAEPSAWGRQLVTMGYAISAAFCRRGIRRMWGVDSEYVFLVCERKKPYLCSLVGVDPAWGAHGAHQVERGLKEWRACVERGLWPGYPARVCYPEIPAWLMKDWENE